jgi:hypothetical protein
MDNIVVTCHSGHGPDVNVKFKEHMFILSEEPSNIEETFPQGLVNKGSFQLTADEAEILAKQLLQASIEAKELDT